MLCDADFQADPPNHTRIPREDVVGVTVVLLTCSYRQQEFIRVGYYVNNEYVDPEFRENPPQEPDFDQVLSVACFLAHMSFTVHAVYF